MQAICTLFERYSHRMDCPDAEALVGMAFGGLSLERRAEIANHAAGCAPCHAALDALLRSRTAELTADPMGSTLAADRAKVETLAAPGEDPARDGHELSAGDRVHRYVIETVLGRGGMGVVYRARDPELGRAVAIKVLQRGTGSGERLLREAQALAKLSHPNVVTVHDMGTHDGQPFIAMALVEGETLRQWLATPRTRRAVLDVLLAAGRGIAAAHEAGLIHRDVKPDNIFVAHSGQVLVGDFGLVRGIDRADREAAGSPGDDARAPWFTRTGMVLGTPAYMAPEQAAGDATMASDQFSFCVTAWQAFTGQRPFAGTTAAERLANIRAASVIEPEGERALPPRLDAALRRGLDADPARRFPSMTELLNALESAMARTEGRPRRIATVAIPGLAATAGVIAIVLATRTSSKEPGQPAGGAGSERAEATVPPPPPTEPGVGQLGPRRCPEGMVHVPAGTFQMGSDKSVGDADEHPQHTVTLSAYCIDETEVTEKAYAACVAAGGCSTAPLTMTSGHFAEDGELWSRFCNRGDRPGHPINCVDWNQAAGYCKWAGKRLPTEAEWEYAARGSDGRVYPWGNEAPSAKRLNGCGIECVAMMKRDLKQYWKMLYSDSDGWETTAPAGSFRAGASPFGALDMAGNVWEWTADWYGDYSRDAATDPLGARTGTERVFRGGGWDSTDADLFRAAFRSADEATVRYHFVGFRCARRE